MLPLMMFKLNLTSVPSVHSLILKFVPKLATHKVGLFGNGFDLNFHCYKCKLFVIFDTLVSSLYVSLWFTCIVAHAAVVTVII